VLDVDTLVDQARQRAGSDDFGDDTWREGLDVLVHALATEGRLNEIGTQVYADQIVGHLSNRLAVERWYAAHPEIDEQEIVAPLFGLGLPRTGSTALSFLLAADRSRRSLRTWEASTPCPPPETASEDTDPRIAASAAGIEITHQMFPDFVGMLPSSPTGPAECLMLMALDFRSMVFDGMALLPSLTEWLMACDMEPAYRYHKRVLKLLQWRCPPTRWWLKTPSHMPCIAALDAVYPDARFVMSHRELGSVLPSVCALKQALMTPLTTEVDVLALGRHETDVWSESLRRLIAFRDAGRDDRFFDVGFADLQRDPLGAMETLYQAMGDDLATDTRTRMQAWWDDSAAERRSAKADPATFGLDIDGIRREFAFYHKRFGITPDSRGGS
jgi:hypothetical protein